MFPSNIQISVQSNLITDSIYTSTYNALVLTIYYAIHSLTFVHMYQQTSKISRTFVGNEIVGHSDVGHSALLQLHLNSGLQWIGQKHLQDETRDILVLGFGATYFRGLTVIPR